MKRIRKYFLINSIIVLFLGIKSPVFGGESLSCVDSDGGLDFYRAGQTHETIASVVNFGSYHVDKCSPKILKGDYLIEYFCQSAKTYYQKYSCPLGCRDGACVNDDASIKPVPAGEVKEASLGMYMPMVPMYKVVPLPSESTSIQQGNSISKAVNCLLGDVCEDVNPFTLSGRLLDSHGRPLKQATVSFWWDDNSSQDFNAYKKISSSWTDNDGRYELKFGKPADEKLATGQGYLRVDLKDKNNTFVIIDWTRGMDSLGDSEKASARLKENYATWYMLGADGISSYIKLSAGDKLELNPDFTLKNKSNAFFVDNNAEANAHIYVNTKIVVDFYKNLGINFIEMPTLRLFSFANPESPFLQQIVQPDVKEPPYSTYLDKKTIADFRISDKENIKITGPLIVLIKSDSENASHDNSYQYRQNAEWHEFTHFINSQINSQLFSTFCLYGDYPIAIGKDIGISTPVVISHEGYYNACSVDSVKEGIAEFMGQVIYNQTFNKNYDSAYFFSDGSPAFNLETNWKIDEEISKIGTRRFDSAVEEEAVAGLLWDIYDPIGAIEKDYFQTDIKTIWQLLTEKIKFSSHNQFLSSLPLGFRVAFIVDRPVTYIPDLYLQFRNFFAHSFISTKEGQTDKGKLWDERVIDSRMFFDDEKSLRQNIFPYSSFDEKDKDIIGFPSPSGFFDPTGKPRVRFSFRIPTASLLTVQSPKEVLPYQATVKVDVASPHNYLSGTYKFLIDQEMENLYVSLPPEPEYHATYALILQKSNSPEEEIFKMTSAEKSEKEGPWKADISAEKGTAEKTIKNLWLYILIGALILAGIGAAVYFLIIKKNPPVLPSMPAGE